MTVEIAGKKYKRGYTTGSCAAAAAKAAATMLINGILIESIEIDTPIGIRLVLDVDKVEIGYDYAVCCVVKDGGDDPDITTGIEIFAKATYSKCNGITIKGGAGVGVVTKKGLKVEVGKSAINPEPMAMILKEVSEVVSEGIEVTIFVPLGKEIAKKTLNAKLGIIGGISIIGTSGIVTPMSEEAWKDSILLELKMKKQYKTVCFVFGNYGIKFAEEILCINREKIVTISNFVGFMLESAVNLGFDNVLLVGHMGKLVKVSSGNFHTHSKISDGRMETICAFAAMNGAKQSVVNEIYNCVTTDAAESLIEQYHLQNVYQWIVKKAEQRCRERIKNEISIGCMLFDNKNKLLGKSVSADFILDKLRNDSIEK